MKQTLAIIVYTLLALWGYGFIVFLIYRWNRYDKAWNCGYCPHCGKAWHHVDADDRKGIMGYVCDCRKMVKHIKKVVPTFTEVESWRNVKIKPTS